MAIIALLLFPSFATSAETIIDGYGDTRWGMSKTEVINAFTGGNIIFQNDMSIFYNGNNGRDNCRYIFSFNDDKLVEVSVFIDNLNNKIGEIKELYKYYKGLLEEKYGKAAGNNPAIWKSKNTTIKIIYEKVTETQYHVKLQYTNVKMMREWINETDRRAKIRTHNEKESVKGNL